MSFSEIVKRSDHICIGWWYGVWAIEVEGGGGGGRPENAQALFKWSCNLSRTVSIAMENVREGQLKSLTNLTLAREQSSEGVHGEEERFCNFQCISHRPISVPKVQASLNLLRSIRRKEVVPRTYIETWVVNHPSWRGWRASE